MSKFKGVIFDLDNTICDTIYAIHKSIKVCYKYLRNYYPHVSYEKFIHIEEKVFFDLTIKRKLPVYSFRAIYWHEIFKELELDLSAIHIKNLISLYTDQLSKNVDLFDGIEEMLIELKKKEIKIVILSNGDFLTKAAMIEYLNIYKYIDHIIASDLIQQDKPNKKAFTYTLEIIGLKENEVAMVGDERVNDIEGAINANIFAFYALWPEKNKNADIDQFEIYNKETKKVEFLKRPLDLLLYIN